MRGTTGGLTVVVTCACLVLGACGDSAPVDPGFEDPASAGDSTGIASVRFTGDYALMTVLGSETRLMVRARDSTDTVVCGTFSPGCASWLLTEPFEWATDMPGVVDLREWGTGLYPNGSVRLTAVADGRAEITVSVAGTADTAVVEVEERARIAWSLTLPGSFRGAAVGVDGTIYVASSEALQALSPEGGEHWRVPMSAQGIPAISEDGTLYATGSNELYHVDTGGTVLWNTPIDGANSAPALAPDGTIYLVNGDGTLHAVDPDGRVRWTFEAPGGLGVNRSPPAIAEDGTVYFGSEDHHLYAVGPDGAELWRFETEGAVRSPSIDRDGTVYFANDRITEWSDSQGRIILADARMFALNAVGTETWSAPIAGDGWAGPAIGFDGTVYIGSMNDGDLYVFSPTGTLEGKLGAQAGHTPIVGGDGSVYRSLSAVTAIDGDGTPRWTFQPGNSASPVPAIGLDGRIYAGTHDGSINELHAFEELGAAHGGWEASPWPQDRGDRANSGRAGG